MMRKYIGHQEFDRSINKYLIDNAYGNGNASKLIDYLVKERSNGNSEETERILHEWLNQPGVSIVIVESNEGEGNTSEYTITMRQVRLHSSYFDSELTDARIKSSIPLFFTFHTETGNYEETIVLDSREPYLIRTVNTTFDIEDDYGELYGVWRVPRSVPEDDERLLRFLRLSDKMFIAGIIGSDEFSRAVTPLANNSRVGRDYLRVNVAPKQERAKIDPWKEIEDYCGDLFGAPLNQLFMKYLEKNKEKVLLCSREAKDREKMKELLRRKIVTDELKIISEQLANLIEEMEKPELQCNL
ncbi:hypothetical protein PMAYCL1PPCAC_22632 [Pristionchus mayeri]|uniref:Uncharacterized protein n=1 Tax=Pristionchus mayeri TaxID=1317129 RepID=A0AAN5I4Z0_9BILA|nr:hypothetical protein PMAYCL1PPCAC_22632 [Pristionchus mayeri]